MTSWLSTQNINPFLIRKIWRYGWISATVISCSGMPSMTGKPSSSAGWPNVTKKERRVVVRTIPNGWNVWPVWCLSLFRLSILCRNTWFVWTMESGMRRSMMRSICWSWMNQGRCLLNWLFRLSALPSKPFWWETWSRSNRYGPSRTNIPVSICNVSAWFLPNLMIGICSCMRTVSFPHPEASWRWRGRVAISRSPAKEAPSWPNTDVASIRSLLIATTMCIMAVCCRRKETRWSIKTCHLKGMSM